MHDVTLRVGGLRCAGCVARAETAFRAAAGVVAAEVNLVAETARLRARDSAAVAAAVEAAAAAGFGVARRRLRLSVEGLRCAGCVARAEAALAATPGVRGASVSLVAGRADVEVFEGAATAQALADALSAAGYPAAPRGAVEGDADAARAAAQAAEAQALRGDALRAAALAAPVAAMEMGGHLSPAFAAAVQAALSLHGAWAIQCALTTALLLGPGRRFFSLGFAALRRGAPDMNSLVALGAGAAWAFSTLVLLGRGDGPVFFESAAVIVALILLGRWLEARARGQAGAAIRALTRLRPKTARRLGDDGPEDVALEAVRVGDLLLVRPGEAIPADGEVVEGRSHVDMALMTGEPTPVAAGPGTALVGGALNGRGALTLRATRVGADAALARIAAMVEDAQAAKLPIQALVDRVAAWFVPAVLVVAAASGAAWLLLGPAPAAASALTAAVSVLIVACPCAMGLATPMSVMVGTGRGAQLGVLARRGEALQRLRDARVVAFDKTGTLTEGAPAVVEIALAEGVTAEAALAEAAGVEAASEHPLARAILTEAARRGVAPDAAAGFEALVGRGARARVAGREVLVGAPRLMAEAGVALGPLADRAAAFAAAGRTPVLLASGGRARAAFAVADPIKPGAAAAVAALKAAGLRVAMISGDARAAAEAVAADVGVDAVIAEAAPGDKAAAVRDLRARFGGVAFVGDGVNDAPALAEADVGLAMGAGADVAVAGADAVLVSGDPRAVATAVGLSRAVIANIRWSLIWAFAYNVALIPVAAGALHPAFGVTLSPMLAAAAMALSSLCVVLNALRLRRWRPAAAV